MKYINGYDDPEIIAGAGTMGIECLEQVSYAIEHSVFFSYFVCVSILYEQVPDMDAIFVPVGGAGLIAGVSLALKTLKPSVQVIGFFEMPQFLLLRKSKSYKYILYNY